MKRLRWNPSDEPVGQIESLTTAASEMGVLAVDFGGGTAGPAPPWTVVEPWTRSRAVTLAIIDGVSASPALDIALCSDLVYLLPTARLHLAHPSETPSPGIIWALGRAGRRALARGLLSTLDVDAVEAVEVGIAHLVIPDTSDLRVAEDTSVVAMTTARDLMRSALPGSAGRALELASFRLMFAAGTPRVGAEAFLNKRKPSF